jgi:hypothetical protein
MLEKNLHSIFQPTLEIPPIQRKVRCSLGLKVIRRQLTPPRGICPKDCLPLGGVKLRLIKFLGYIAINSAKIKLDSEMV